MKEAMVEKVMIAHNLPHRIATTLVDDNGIVDNNQLSAVLLGIGWGHAPASQAEPGLMRALSDSYYLAMDRSDFTGMISLKRALFKIGADLLPRK